VCGKKFKIEMVRRRNKEGGGESYVCAGIAEGGGGHGGTHENGVENGNIWSTGTRGGGIGVIRGETIGLRNGDGEENMGLYDGRGRDGEWQ